MRVVIFAPSPVLTITVEGDADSGEPDVHVHPGGQGVWQARMLRQLGADVTLCGVFTGETGVVQKHLLNDEGIDVIAVDRPGRGGAYIHDRRSGERATMVETGGDSLSRHELDEVYGHVIGAALDADLAILSGPASDDALPAEVYRRLASDLRETGRRVIVDLAGERLVAAIEGRAYLVKVSDEELLADGLITESTTDDISTAIARMRESGVEVIVVTRAEKPLLLLAEDVLSEVSTPHMQVADHRGAGDSLTAGIAAALGRGSTPEEAVRLGAAAGALNVTRHGLGTGDAETIARFTELVDVRQVTGPNDTSEGETP
ncbi:1-phosphofructokinase [Microbacteriaceae bacterium SG_E_30_P1]|uniref:1-phosphofructokinase n=1 Tax=Antiquaquibacter oligotrophicus TaxID=2880260 RepID=A0ABT6KKY8_9MICO|nr:PfkB family carbohydrate kinase [Antiquaquibacter oligotrophicus]MDH6180666.1 1-phosphofructokinase [Antiquaquibacter oligotrophicus]UDF13606.1 PfkB family carbohydrate kinase [Antiquaquibacter oligotrophicus]